jgi:hypothetical protein
MRWEMGQIGGEIEGIDRGLMLDRGLVVVSSERTPCEWPTSGGPTGWKKGGLL